VHAESNGDDLLRDVVALVVDDDHDSASLLSMLLAAAGCDVRVAHTAEEALDVLGAFRPRLIILDLVLPRMSGLLLVRHVKASTLTREAVVIAVSAVSGADAERVALGSGCAAYVAKPIDPLTFTRTVARHLADAGRGRLDIHRESHEPDADGATLR